MPRIGQVSFADGNAGGVLRLDRAGLKANI